MFSIHWNGCWDADPWRNKCRWMVAWIGYQEDILGCVGGYSGGGAFQLEKFKIYKGEIILGADEGFGSLLSDIEISTTEDCQDMVLDFHEDTPWMESDNMVLKKSKIKYLSLKGDVYVGGGDIPSSFSKLFEGIGLAPRF